MVQAPTRTLTLEAFLQQPDTKPASEYIDGKIIQKPMPKTDHSVIQGDLTAARAGWLALCVIHSFEPWCKTYVFISLHVLDSTVLSEYRRRHNV